jgi:hypothetical protein
MKNHFAMTLYVIGSFFPALAARDRVKATWLEITTHYVTTIYYW